MALSPIGGADGEAKAQGAAQDAASAKRKARPRGARADKSPRAIEAALAGIAHDIRTPLTGIVALAELLASSDLGQREREWANAVRSGAEHLAALSTLIVDAAKADVTGLTLRNEPFSPRALAEAVGEGLTARAGNKNVATKVEIAEDLPAMVAADAMRLRAALENLADNAVKFTEGGAVAFAAQAEPAARGRVRLAFTVTDSGIGMSASELKRLFRPFAQASADIAAAMAAPGSACPSSNGSPRRWAAISRSRARKVPARRSVSQRWPSGSTRSLRRNTADRVPQRCGH